MAGPASDAVRRLAALSVEAGAQGVVCSPQEVAAVRGEVGRGITLITPGVRLAGADAHDQARVATPEQALPSGCRPAGDRPPDHRRGGPGSGRGGHRGLAAEGRCRRSLRHKGGGALYCDVTDRLR